MARPVKKPAYRAPALEKGIAILELLAEARRPLTVADIAGSMRRSRPEIYRMLVVLESLNYLLRTEDGSYDLSGRMFEVASRHAPRRHIVAAARAAMQMLAERTQQSCHLMVNSGDHMVCVAREESPAAIGFAVQVGFRPALPQSTSGRLHFAFQEESRQALICKRLGAAASRELRADAARIRRQGYAAEPSRLTTGIEDLCAPVFAHDGLPAACLTIPFVSHRLFPVTRRQALKMLLEAASEITDTLRTGTR